jgi:hypothetical protein
MRSIIRQQKYEMMPCMEDDDQTYLLPHPSAARVILTLAGAAALVLAPYELVGGVWPLNVTSLFFGFIMLGGMSVGAMFVWAGLAMPSGKLTFRQGCMEVERQYLWGTRRSLIHAADVSAVEVCESESMEGPNDWYAVIRADSQEPIGSRPLGTKDEADAMAQTFRRKLGLDQAFRS